jgi:hypothetical protein
MKALHTSETLVYSVRLHVNFLQEGSNFKFTFGHSRFTDFLMSSVGHMKKIRHVEGSICVEQKCVWNGKVFRFLAVPLESGFIIVYTKYGVPLSHFYRVN